MSRRTASIEVPAVARLSWRQKIAPFRAAETSRATTAGAGSFQFVVGQDVEGELEPLVQLIHLGLAAPAQRHLLRQRLRLGEVEGHLPIGVAVRAAHEIVPD